MRKDVRDRINHTANVMLVVVTSVLVLLGLLEIMGHFYHVVVVMSLTTVLTYILLGPVRMMESALTGLREMPFMKKLSFGLPGVTPRLFSVMLVYFTFFLVISAIGSRLLPVLAQQFEGLGRAVPGYVAQAEVTMLEWSSRFLGTKTLKSIFQKEIEDAYRQGEVQETSKPGTEMTLEEKNIIHKSVFRKTLEHSTKLVHQWLSSAMENVANLVIGTFNGFIYCLSGMLLLFYLLLEGRKLGDGFIRITPDRLQPITSYFVTSFHEVMSAFVKGQFFLGIITGTYMFLIYTIFDVEYAIFLSAFFGVAEFLPVIGTWIGITPGLIVILFTQDPITAVWVWMCSYCYQTIKDNIVAPKIVGDVMGLHPVVVIISLLICGKALGLLGVLLALPLASMVNITLRYFFQEPIPLSTLKNEEPPPEGSGA